MYYLIYRESTKQHINLILEDNDGNRLKIDFLTKERDPSLWQQLTWCSGVVKRNVNQSQGTQYYSYKTQISEDQYNRMKQIVESEQEYEFTYNYLVNNCKTQTINLLRNAGLDEVANKFSTGFIQMPVNRLQSFLLKQEVVYGTNDYYKALLQKIDENAHRSLNENEDDFFSEPYESEVDLTRENIDSASGKVDELIANASWFDAILYLMSYLIARLEPDCYVLQSHLKEVNEHFNKSQPALPSIAIGQGGDDQQQALNDHELGAEPSHGVEQKQTSTNNFK